MWFNENMAPSQVLNRLAYPQAGDNARAKHMNYYDTVTLVTGQTEYDLYRTPLG
jgi:hypothetical protein